MSFRGRLKRFYRDFISLGGEAKSIALGMAIGVFVGITPTIPFHTLLIIMATFLCRTNFSSAILGSCLVSNPFSIPVLYTSQYCLGRFILGIEGCKITLLEFSLKEIINMGWSFGYPLLIGGIIMAPLLAIPAYFVTYRAVRALREKKELC